ncbi:hypothetical protein KY338_05255 [Candidatus Woesearchaeota archaeon]|nr:hypothetical protein [Candidatus Woesearchaeota archaeon]MBW3005558.1 hypothetical protein [Candidatus Woesearchaeota archaeon]
MHKFTPASLERIIERLNNAVTHLKKEKKETEQAGKTFDFDYVITLFEETHLKDYRRILAKLNRWGYSSETVEEVRLRDVVEHVMSPLNQENQLSDAAKILAKYIVNPDETGKRKKQSDYVGLERLTLIVSNSKNKNIFDAWAKEWEIDNFYDKDLGVKKQFRCDACGNQSSKNVTIINAETGSKLSFNYQCFNNLTADLGKLGGVISSVEHAKKETSDAQARKFQELLEKALDKMEFEEAAGRIKKELPEEYRIVADPEAWLEQLGSMYEHFRQDIDFTTGSKEFEPHASLRTWSRIRFEDENVPEPVRLAHEKFLSLSKMTLAERLLFIQDYKLNRAVSILENKDMLDDLFLLELQGEANLDPIRHLFKSRITKTDSDKIAEFRSDFLDTRRAHNSALIKKYGPEIIDSSLRIALTYFFRDRAGWAEAYQRQEKFLDASLSKKDYAIINRICERLTLGFPQEMPIDYDAEAVQRILLDKTPMLIAKEWMRELAVIQRKLDYGKAKSDETSKLHGEYIPAEEFHDFTDIDRRFSLSTVIDKIAHSYARTSAHMNFVEQELPGLKKAVEHSLIDRALTFHKDTAYELRLTDEQARTLKQISNEIRKLDKRIKAIKVPRQASEEKTKLNRKRDELVTQRDELIIRRYLSLKGDYLQYTLRNVNGERINQHNSVLGCTLKTIFDGVRDFKPASEYGDLPEKIAEIADIIEKSRIFLHVPNLPEYYFNPETLRKIKYVDEEGVAKLSRIHGLLTAPTKALEDAIKAIEKSENPAEVIAKMKAYAEKNVQLLKNLWTPQLMQIGLKEKHKSKSKGVEFYAFDSLQREYNKIKGCITLDGLVDELRENKEFEKAVTGPEEYFLGMLNEVTRSHSLFKKIIEIVKSDTDLSNIYVAGEIVKTARQTIEDMPYFPSQIRRKKLFEDKSEKYIRETFVQSVFEKIQEQPEKERQAYWRLINGQKMYFSRKEGEKGWKEGPKYGMDIPDEKYWQSDLLRFLDGTTPGELRGWKRRPRRWERRPKWVEWDFRHVVYVANGTAAKFSYRRNLEEKLRTHAQDNSVRLSEDQAEKLFIPVARKFEALVNEVLKEM